MPQKLIGNQLQQGRITAFVHQIEQLPAEAVQTFVQATINTMILVREIAMFNVKVVLITTINRKKVLPELQIMFIGKINRKELISPGLERRPDSHRGFIQIRKSQIRQLQTEEERAVTRFPMHVDTIM